MYNGIRDRHSEQDQKKLIAQEYYDRIKKNLLPVKEVLTLTPVL